MKTAIYQLTGKAILHVNRLQLVVIFFMSVVNDVIMLHPNIIMCVVYLMLSIYIILSDAMILIINGKSNSTFKALPGSVYLKGSAN